MLIRIEGGAYLGAIMTNMGGASEELIVDRWCESLLKEAC
jgi:hypothetical protein